MGVSVGPVLLLVWTVLVIAGTWLVTRGHEVGRSQPAGVPEADVFAQARDVLNQTIADGDSELPSRVGQRQSQLSVRQQADTQAAAAAIVQGHLALAAIPSYLRQSPDDDEVTPTQRYAAIVQTALTVLRAAEADSYESDTTTLRALETYVRSQWADGALDLDDEDHLEPVRVIAEASAPRPAAVVVTDYPHPDWLAAIADLGGTGRHRDAAQVRAWMKRLTRSEQERSAVRATEVVTACRQQQLSWSDGRVQEAMYRLRDAAQEASRSERQPPVSLSEYVPDWLGEAMLTLKRIGDGDSALALGKDRAWLTPEQEALVAHDAQRLDRICREPAHYPAQSRRIETEALLERVGRLRDQTRRDRRTSHG